MRNEKRNEKMWSEGGSFLLSVYGAMMGVAYIMLGRWGWMMVIPGAMIIAGAMIRFIPMIVSNICEYLSEKDEEVDEIEEAIEEQKQRNENNAAVLSWMKEQCEELEEETRELRDKTYRFVEEKEKEELNSMREEVRNAEHTINFLQSTMVTLACLVLIGLFVTLLAPATIHIFFGEQIARISVYCFFSILVGLSSSFFFTWSAYNTYNM